MHLQHLDPKGRSGRRKRPRGMIARGATRRACDDDHLMMGISPHGRAQPREVLALMDTEFPFKGYF